jgi:hypothetical protein
MAAIALLAAGWMAAAPSPARAQDMTCEEHTEVSIDVRPGQFPNKINLSSQGLLPVAVLSTDTFDASLFDPEMAHLSDAATAEGCGGATAVRWSYEDVNGDGRIDLLFLFRIQQLDFTAGTTEAMLMAHGMYQGTMIHIMGTDMVTVKG